MEAEIESPYGVETRMRWTVKTPTEGEGSEVTLEVERRPSWWTMGWGGGGGGGGGEEEREGREMMEGLRKKVEEEEERRRGQAV